MGKHKVLSVSLQEASILIQKLQRERVLSYSECTRLKTAVNHISDWLDEIN